MNQLFENARNFIYRNARPLEFALWKYHFEGGSKEAVLEALSYYQNEDGGFGHALEADSWNPYSVPIQTWTATEILREIDFTDISHPIMQGILRYLESGACFDGHCWYAAVPENNNYPHAPWWETQENSVWGYNPTACLAGFIIRFAKKGSALYELGCRVAKEAFAYLVNHAERVEGNISCYIRLLEYCREADAMDLFDLQALENRLKEEVKADIWPVKGDWEFKYVPRPSNYITGKNSIFYEDNKELADYECEFIAKTQLPDGSWNLSWSWKDYSNEWAIGKNWWKCTRIIGQLLYLRKTAEAVDF